MRLVDIDRAKNGDLLGQPIMGSDGNYILREGIVLTDRYIRRLKELGVQYIYIIDDKLEDILPQDPKFVEVKNEALKSVSKVFSKVQFSGEIEINNTINTITNIVRYLLENKDISSIYLLELKTFDNYTYVHCLNTCVLALFFGIQLGYNEAMLIDLGVGALLHDIGKTKIPIEILNKNGNLTDLEYETIKRHPEYGYEMVRDIDYINERGKRIVLEHHERVDGNGYPRGLKGDEISKFAKITCISDVYDAIISDRVYRKGFAANEAYEFILSGTNTIFDYELVNIFKENFSIYPLGVCVKLSNGIEAFVVGHNKGFPDRPIVRVLYDENGNVIKPYEINFIEKLDITVKKIII